MRNEVYAEYIELKNKNKILKENIRELNKIKAENDQKYNSAHRTIIRFFKNYVLMPFIKSVIIVYILELLFLPGLR